MGSDVVFLLIGLGMIVFGGDLFVSASVRIAELLKMPRIVIGTTLVSLATTGPEMVVSVMSGLKNESGLAVGNALGSCVCNAGLILGTMAIIRAVKVNPVNLRFPLSVMIFLGIFLLLMTLDLNLSRFQGGVLIFLGVSYFFFDFLRNKRDSSQAHLNEAVVIEEEIVHGPPFFSTPLGAAMQFLAGAIVLVMGARFLVNAAVHVAVALGIPTLVIGLTLLAFGTSLPELVTAINCARKNVTDMAVGNIIGANIANLSLVVGSAAGFHPLTLQPLSQAYNFPALVIGLTALYYLIRSERLISRKEGICLVSYYAIYLAGLIYITPHL